MSCCNNFEVNPTEPLICNDPCPCTKCKNKRKEEEEDEAHDKKIIADVVAGHTKFLIFTTQVISLLAFLIFTIIMIWINVSKYAIHLVIKIYKADKNTKIAIALLVGLLTLSIALNLIMVGAKRMISQSGGCRFSKASQPKHSCFGGMFSGWKGKGQTITVAPKNPTDKMWHKPAKSTDKDKENKSITVTITDSHAREVFRQSKLFAVPTEMKRPPAALVYLNNVILKNY